MLRCFVLSCSGYSRPENSSVAIAALPSLAAAAVLVLVGIVDIVAAVVEEDIAAAAARREKRVVEGSPRKARGSGRRRANDEVRVVDQGDSFRQEGARSKPRRQGVAALVMVAANA